MTKIKYLFAVIFFLLSISAFSIKNRKIKIFRNVVYIGQTAYPLFLYRTEMVKRDFMSAVSKNKIISDSDSSLLTSLEGLNEDKFGGFYHLYRNFISYELDYHDKEESIIDLKKNSTSSLKYFKINNQYRFKLGKDYYLHFGKNDNMRIICIRFEDPRPKYGDHIIGDMIDVIYKHDNYYNFFSRDSDIDKDMAAQKIYFDSFFSFCIKYPTNPYFSTIFSYFSELSGWLKIPKIQHKYFRNFFYFVSCQNVTYMIKDVENVLLVLIHYLQRSEEQNDLVNFDIELDLFLRKIPNRNSVLKYKILEFLKQKR